MGTYRREVRPSACVPNNTADRVRMHRTRWGMAGQEQSPTRASGASASQIRCERLAHINRQRQIHKLRHVISELARHIPDAVRKDQMIADLSAYGCLTKMHVVRLLAPRLENENHTKDIDFSPEGVGRRWEAGYADTSRVLQRKAWEDACDPLEGIILHEQETD